MIGGGGTGACSVDVCSYTRSVHIGSREETTQQRNAGQCHPLTSMKPSPFPMRAPVSGSTATDPTTMISTFGISLSRDKGSPHLFMRVDVYVYVCVGNIRVHMASVSNHAHAHVSMAMVWMEGGS